MAEPRVVKQRDPYLSEAIASRGAVLWIGPSFNTFTLGQDPTSCLQSALLRRWAAVFLDCPGLPVSRITEEHTQAGDLTLRYSDGEPQVNLPENRLPIYGLRGPKGTVGPGSHADPLGMLYRLSMLKQMPADLEVIVIGVNALGDLDGLVEAAKVAPLLRRLTIVAPETLSLDSLTDLSLDRLIHWVGSWADFHDLLEHLTADLVQDVIRVRVKTNAKDSERKSVNIAGCIDKSHPITQSFDLIPSERVSQRQGGFRGRRCKLLRGPYQQLVSLRRGCSLPSAPSLP